MAGNPTAFAYMYKVAFDGTDYTIVDGDSETGNGLTPAESSVMIKDDIDDGDRERHTIVGDVDNDQFHVTQAGALNGAYSFTFLATINSGNGFIAQNTTTGEYFYFTNDQLDDSQVGNPLGTEDGNLQVCFMAGTMIRTPSGATPVEALQRGDLVATADGRSVAVCWIGRQTVAPRFGDGLQLPVRIKAGAIADTVPSRDLLVSPDHALFIGGVLIHAGALVNGTSIVRESNVPAIFTYYHVEVDDHSLILAEDAPAETFIDNVDRRQFDNWAEFEALYPEGRDLAEMAYPRAKAFRQVPRAVRAELDRRAMALLGEVGQAA